MASFVPHGISVTTNYSEYAIVAIIFIIYMPRNLQPTSNVTNFTTVIKEKEIQACLIDLSVRRFKLVAAFYAFCKFLLWTTGKESKHFG